jgi:hypothetical protein
MGGELRPCPGCGADVPDIDGPIHRYIGASPGCWAAYGELSEREVSAFRYMRSHRLTVDAYCAQHPGTPSAQAIRSVAVHLVGLHPQLERGVPAEELYGAQAPRFPRQGKQAGLFWLEPPVSLGGITVLDLLGAEGREEYGGLARRWAEAVWGVWSEHHQTMRRWTGG